MELGWMTSYTATPGPSQAKMNLPEHRIPEAGDARAGRGLETPAERALGAKAIPKVGLNRPDRLWYDARVDTGRSRRGTRLFASPPSRLQDPERGDRAL